MDRLESHLVSDLLNGKGEAKLMVLMFYGSVITSHSRGHELCEKLCSPSPPECSNQSCSPQSSKNSSDYIYFLNINPFPRYNFVISNTTIYSKQSIWMFFTKNECYICDNYKNVHILETIGTYLYFLSFHDSFPAAIKSKKMY